MSSCSEENTEKQKTENHHKPNCQNKERSKKQVIHRNALKSYLWVAKINRGASPSQPYKQADSQEK